MAERKQRSYIAIDLKSFYASVECAARGLDPLTENLVVADLSRTEKTICLAVSPSLKACGIGGRARLFEVVQRVREVNAERLQKAPEHHFTGKSSNAAELAKDPSLELDYVVATPRMRAYIEESTKIYEIYLRYIAPEDIHVYSIDEVFMDVTDYLHTYNMTPHELAIRMIREVLAETGITATAGIGTNLYLAKVAMDIVAKHMDADADGVRIAELDEMRYRRLLWNHEPLTDFWRVGRGYAKKLRDNGLYTMGDIARCSLGGAEDFHNEELLYGLFGINAELLIDHAWGYEPCGMKEIKAYRPETNSIGSGQVLACPYTVEDAAIIVREMVDELVLHLVEKQLVTDQIVLDVNYDRESLADPEVRRKYKGPVSKDWYGREAPKHAHGSANLPSHTSSTRKIVDETMALYERITNPLLLVRRLYVTANHVIPEEEYQKQKEETYEQLDLFTDFAALEKEREEADSERQEEKNLQESILAIKKKFGQNAILKGTNLMKGATAIERHDQIGGHKA